MGQVQEGELLALPEPRGSGPFCRHPLRARISVSPQFAPYWPVLGGRTAHLADRESGLQRPVTWPEAGGGPGGSHEPPPEAEPWEGPASARGHA